MTATMTEAVEKARRARAASRVLATASADQRNAALLGIADALERESARILAVNAPEVERAKAKGITDAFIDRIVLP